MCSTSPKICSAVKNVAYLYNDVPLIFGKCSRILNGILLTLTGFPVELIVFNYKLKILKSNCFNLGQLPAFLHRRRLKTAGNNGLAGVFQPGSCKY